MAGRDEERDRDASTAARDAPPAGATLLVFGANGPARHPLGGSGVLVLGRGREADVFVDDGAASRRHAALHVGASLQIEDLESANGTRIDGQPLAPGRRVVLQVGAIVEIGQARLVVRREDAARRPMDAVHEVIAKIAPSALNVVLVGETGAGKEVLAEAIHRRSPRAAGPLVRLNCAAVPESLIESELFGHERGAFTGASQAKSGLIESAHGGTMLLDEIGELSEAVQVRLLRVLENHEVRRVGAVAPRVVDVRFVSATHRDLDLMTALGKFRQDLLFRLNGITIQVPPLRARANEIPRLAGELLADALARAGRSGVTLAPDALLLLESYRWPGNVRELRTVIERGIHLSGTDRVEIAHLVFGKSISIVPEAPGSPPEDDERARIARALEQCSGNQKEAAKMLGMTRRVLGTRIEKLNLPRPRKGPSGRQ